MVKFTNIEGLSIAIDPKQIVQVVTSTAKGSYCLIKLVGGGFVTVAGGFASVVAKVARAKKGA